MTTVAEMFGCGNLVHIQEFLAGIECEIEAIENPPPDVNIFHAILDGSLRNNGYEYVSAPASRQVLVESFKELHKHLKFKKDDDPFSIRTSTHVHVNCQSLTPAQARTLVLLYALFEEFFFMMVKPTRRDNIHCVPLTETPMPRIYKKDIMVMFKNWSKYTALNLKRMSDLGTMEFRHLHGTGDASELDCWLSVLENLWKLAQRVEIKKDTLTKENIHLWFESIFSPSPRVLSLRHSLFDVVRNNLIDVKFSV